MPKTFPQGPISLIEKHSWDDFVQALREVPLFGDRSVFPYKNATIESRIVGFNDVYPISLYLLRHHLDMQHELRKFFLKEYGIDTLDLNGGTPGLTFQLAGEKETWHMGPPIVEISKSDGGKAILLDGEHRFMIARELKKPIRVIWIDTIPKEYPPVSLPVEWKDVQILTHVPSEQAKRKYRPSPHPHYFFYRDLSGVVSSSIREKGST